MSLDRRTPLKRTGFASKPRKPLPAMSAKALRERPLRAETRREVLGRDGGCIPALLGVPGACGPVGERSGLEVHEVAHRSTHPGSHLRPELAVATCPRHHDLIQSPVGEMRVLVESLGLLVRATT